MIYVTIVPDGQVMGLANDCKGVFDMRTLGLFKIEYKIGMAEEE